MNRYLGATGLLHVGALALFAFSSATPALAQQGDPQPTARAGAGFEEIIVTARRREESLQDVPASITAATGEALQERGVRELRDIQRTTSGLSFATLGGGQPLISLRGDSNRIGVTEPGTGVFVDGVYVVRATQLGAGPVDVARVEVVKGPQSSLYGRNTIAGAINIITADPTFEWEGEIEAGYGLGDFEDENISHVTGYVSGPIVADKLAVRVSVSHQERDGYLADTISGARALGYDTDYVRVTALFQPTQSLTWRLSASHRTNDAPRAETLQVEPGLGVLFARPGLPAPTFGSTIWDLRTNIDPLGRSRANSVTSEIEYDAGWGTLTAITNYQTAQLRQRNDPDGTAFDIADVYVHDENSALSQEIRLAGESDAFDWLLGVYYLDEDAERTEQTIEFGVDSITRLAGVATQFLSLPVDSQTYAAFTQIGLDVTDNITITGGLRYASDEKEGPLTQRVTTVTGVVLPNAFTVNRSETFESLTGNIVGQYRLSEDAQLYASYARGNKSGGFSAATVAAAAVIPYDEQFVDAFEIGFKSDLFDRRLRLNIAGFYNDYTDLQVQQTTVLALPGGGSTVANVTSNAAEAQAFGVDLEVSALLSERLRLDMFYTYLDANIERYAIAPGLELRDLDVPRSPRHSASLGLSYTHPIGQGELRLGGVVNIRSDFANEIVLNGASLRTAEADGYETLDLRAAFAWDQWEVSGYINNVSNEEYVQAATIFAGGAYANLTPGEPRTFEISVKRRF